MSAPLKLQVNILADLLAIALSDIEDAELDAFFEGYAVDKSAIRQNWLLAHDEASEALRERWRKTSGYAAAKLRIRKHLERELRHGKQPDTAHAA